MKAIILAAGEGKRLQPLTKDIPKCMVKLFGRSILEQQIKTLQDSNIKEIIVVTGYKNEKIQFSNIKKYTNRDFKSTNMLETLFCAKEELVNSVIISYGDIIYEKNVLDLLIKSEENFSVIIDKKWEEYWRIRMEDPINDVESLKIDSEGYITNIGERVNDSSEIQGQYIGLMKFQNEGLEILKRFYENSKKQAKKTGKNPLNPNIPFKKSYITDFIRGLIKAGHKIKSIPIENGWLELDTYKDFEIYTKMFEEKTISEIFEVKNE